MILHPFSSYTICIHMRICFSLSLSERIIIKKRKTFSKIWSKMHLNFVLFMFYIHIERNVPHQFTLHANENHFTWLNLNQKREEKHKWNNIHLRSVEKQNICYVFCIYKYKHIYNLICIFRVSKRFIATINDGILWHTYISVKDPLMCAACGYVLCKDFARIFKVET